MTRELAVGILGLIAMAVAAWWIGIPVALP